jgi:hypothetical protein
MIIWKSQSKEGPQLDLTLSFTLEIVLFCPVLFVWCRRPIIVPAIQSGIPPPLQRD